METDPDIVRQAIEVSREHSYIASKLPNIPELTDDLLLDAKTQLDLSDEVIDRISHYFGLSTQSTCEKLLEIVDKLGSGLDPMGKRMWLSAGFAAGHTFEQMLDNAETLQDSPAT